MIRGAALLLRVRGIRPSSRLLFHIARLARSFARDGMGKYEALSAAGTLALREYGRRR
jgi:hypothetical protein